MTDADWEERVAAAWASIDERSETEFLASIESLASELPAGSAAGTFERAAALDSTGHSDLAVPLYQTALEEGLTGERRRRAVIQMASSLRNIGRPEDSVAPAITALGITVAFVGLLLKSVWLPAWGVVWAGTLLTLIGLLMWLWPRRDLREREPAERGPTERRPVTREAVA